MCIRDRAKAQYAAIGVDTERAISLLLAQPISIHCWQGDDVTGFEAAGEALSGGIQATGNYPGKARTPEELMQDMDRALSLVPGRHRINLHASYAVFPGAPHDRDRLLPEDFDAWVDYAAARGLGIDFNPTFFSHPMVKDNLTLSSPDEAVRSFWAVSYTHLGAVHHLTQQLKLRLRAYWAQVSGKEIPAEQSAKAEFQLLRQVMDGAYANPNLADAANLQTLAEAMPVLAQLCLLYTSALRRWRTWNCR